MTVPITFDPGCDAPPEVFVSAAEAAEHITADCLRDGPVGRVGLGSRRTPSISPTRVGAPTGVR